MKEVTKRIATLQKMDKTSMVVAEVQQTEDKLDGVLKVEDTMWFRRSRALWLKDGD